MFRWRLAAGLALAALGLAGAYGGVARGQDGGPVYVAEVEGEVDLGLASYLRRVLRRAGEDGASAVVVRINTPGGRLDAALQMKNAILGSPVRVIAFVDREAFSAGALIAIAAQRVYMAPAGVMGAATPVVGDTGETASEKVVSAVRKDFKSVAEARGRNPQVAEAMVDPAVAVDGLVEAGKLLTLTTAEALEWGYADGQAESVGAVLAAEGLGGARLVATSPGWAEAATRFVTNPLVASLLMSLGFLGLLFEVTSPGFGVPGIAGLALLALFFWGHALAGLAGWEGLVLVVVGAGLIALEVFVVPGFGIVGVLGIMALLSGLFISMVGGEATAADYTRAGYTLLGALLAAAAGGYALVRLLPEGRAFRGLVLRESLEASRGPSAPPRVDIRAAGAGGQGGHPSLAGARGVALTDLRPAGVARFGDRRVDVVTEGEYLAAGSPVEVVADEGYRRVVREAPTEAGPPGGSPKEGGD